MLDKSNKGEHDAGVLIKITEGASFKCVDCHKENNEADAMRKVADQDGGAIAEELLEGEKAVNLVKLALKSEPIAFTDEELKACIDTTHVDKFTFNNHQEKRFMDWPVRGPSARVVDVSKVPFTLPAVAGYIQARLGEEVRSYSILPSSARVGSIKSAAIAMQYCAKLAEQHETTDGPLLSTTLLDEIDEIASHVLCERVKANLGSKVLIQCDVVMPPAVLHVIKKHFGADIRSVLPVVGTKVTLAELGDAVEGLARYDQVVERLNKIIQVHGPDAYKSKLCMKTRNEFVDGYQYSVTGKLQAALDLDAQLDILRKVACKA